MLKIFSSLDFYTFANKNQFFRPPSTGHTYRKQSWVPPAPCPPGDATILTKEGFPSNRLVFEVFEMNITVYNSVSKSLLEELMTSPNNQCQLCQSEIMLYKDHCTCYWIKYMCDECQCLLCLSPKYPTNRGKQGENMWFLSVNKKPVILNVIYNDHDKYVRHENHINPKIIFVVDYP